MVGSNRIRLHVLCEDPLQISFVRRLAIERWKMLDRQLRVTAAPVGRGSASDFVLDNVVDAVRLWRSYRHDRNVKLLVVIDGDGDDLARRRQQIGERLAVAGLPPLDPSDPGSAILVPCWHIETWIAWLCGHRPIDERTRYKSIDPKGREVGRMIEGGAYTVRKSVDAWLPAADDESTHVPGLTRGRSELRRIGLTA